MTATHCHGGRDFSRVPRSSESKAPADLSVKLRKYTSRSRESTTCFRQTFPGLHSPPPNNLRALFLKERETLKTPTAPTLQLANGYAVPISRKLNSGTKLTTKSRKRVKSNVSIPFSQLLQTLSPAEFAFKQGLGRAGGRGSLTGPAAPVQTGRRLTGSPPPPPPAPRLTARQTQHHTCSLLRTTTPASLSPPLASTAPLGPPHTQPEPESEPRGARAGGAAAGWGGERQGAGGARAVGAPPRESGLTGTTQPEAPRPGPPLATRPPADTPGCAQPAGGRRERWASGAPATGRGSPAPAGREGAAAAPQPEAWRRAAGGGAGRDGACSGPPTPQGG